MQAYEFCTKAAVLVNGDRADTHGNLLENFYLISSFWQNYLTSSIGVDIELKPSDVANMMILLKVARSISGEYNADDFIDMAGYAGIAGYLSDSNVDEVNE
jgi:hypothetical protein